MNQPLQKEERLAAELEELDELNAARDEALEGAQSAEEESRMRAESAGAQLARARTEVEVAEAGLQSARERAAEVADPNGSTRDRCGGCV